MAWVIIGAAAVGAITAGMKASSANKQNASIRRRFREAEKQIKPAKILQTARTLTPQMRQMIVGQMGPAFRQNVQRGITRAGLRGSGLEAAYTTAAYAAPEFAAFEAAIERAMQIQTLRAQIRTGAAPQGTAHQNVGAAAIGGAAQGAFGAGMGAGNIATAAGPATVSPLSTGGTGASNFMYNNPIPSFGPKFPGATGY